MANSRGRYFDDAPPPPPPGSESYRNSKHGEMNPAYSQYSSKPYQASAYIQPRNSVNPPVPGLASNGSMNYPNAPPPPPQYSTYPAFLPPPPPPLPPKYAPHSAPPPPPPPEPYPTSAQHGFVNHFKPQSGFGHRPQFRPQQNVRPRAQAQFSERGFRPRSQFHPQEYRQRYPDSKEFSPRFKPFTGMRFQRPQHPREFRPAGHRQPSNNYRNEGPSRYPVRNQNGAPLLRLHTERFGHNPVRAGGSDDRVARNPPGVSNGSECRVARNPGTSRFSDEVKPTSGSLLPPWKSASESETSDVKIDLNSQPLQPPPMPPMFTWSESEMKPPESITELKLSEPGLPFLPVPMEKIDLVQMAQVLEKQQAEDNGATIRNLVKDGSILAQWPQELKELFQPLYCKLCGLTLSSAIVAMDHYKGKKHHKKADMWLAERRQKNRVQTTIPHFVRSADLALNRVPQISVAAPISGSNCTPLGHGFSGIGGSVRPAGRKRNASEGVYNPSGVSKTFPLGRPPKNPKKEPLNTRSFDYCHPCKVALTSHSHAEQHFTGKPHAKKVATMRKEGNFGDDSRFGIGKSFNKTDSFSTQDQPSSTESARPRTPLAMEDFPTEHQRPTVVENFTPLAQLLPAAEVFSAQQIPAAEVFSAQQIPATELFSAQQIPATELFSAQQIPAVENNVTLF